MNKKDLIIELLRLANYLDKEAEKEAHGWFGSLGRANQYSGACAILRWLSKYVDDNLTEI